MQIKRMMVLALAGFGLVTNAFAQQTPPATASGGLTTADMSARKKAGFDLKKAQAESIARLDGDATQVAMRTFWVVIPSAKSPNHQAAAAKVSEDWANGTLGLPHTASGPADYTLVGITRQVSWVNFMFSSNLDFHTWNGDENPEPPYNGEYGNIVYAFVEVTGINGDVWLTGLSSKASASHDANIDETISLAGAAYSPGARGVKSDNSSVTSGSGTTRVKKFLVGVAPEMYLGNSPEGVDAVWNWLQNVHPDFWLGMEFTFKDNSTTLATTSTKVGLQGFPAPAVPQLLIVAPDHQAGFHNYELATPEGVSGKRYIIVRRANVDSGGWDVVGFVSNANTFTLTNDPSGFYALWPESF